MNLCSFHEWLAEQPPVVRAAAEQFPPGTIVMVDGDGRPERLRYVVGWSTVDGGADALLILSEHDPGVDYDAAADPLQVEHACRGHCTVVATEVPQ